ncbi:17229_t:CDS:2, partial [Racocetra persica]
IITNQKVIVDAIYKMNILGYELYAIIALFFVYKIYDQSGVQWQGIYPFIFLPISLSTNTNKETISVLNDLTNTASFQPTNLTNEEQENIGNKQWAQAVQTSFEGVNKLVNDINNYQRRITNP